MRTIKLTDEQANILVCYLLITTDYRKEETEACQRLSQEKNEDGKLRFPNMEGNARWWEKAHAEIDEIRKAIDAAPYVEEETV
ncbi:MAG: hypothetical protein RR365_00790 [Bacteroides sp.]